MEHWNGTSWSVVSSPNVGYYVNNELRSVAAESANDVWAVGYTDNGTLIEHWNGTSWLVVSSPNVGMYENYLYGIGGASGNSMWAVGEYWNGSVSQTLM